MTVRDEDLGGLSHEPLVDEVLRLRPGIRQHRDSSGHEHRISWQLCRGWRVTGGALVFTSSQNVSQAASCSK